MSPTGPEGAPVSQHVAATIPAVAAGSAQTSAVGDMPFDGTVTAASFIPDAAIVGNTANTRTFNLVNRLQDGTGVAVVATLAFITGTNGAALDEVVMALSGTPANLSVAADDVLALVETIAGTGLANPGGRVQIDLARR